MKITLSHTERLKQTIAAGKADRTPVALWRHFPVDDQSPGSLAAATFHFQNTYDFDLVKVTPASSFCLRDWGVEDEWLGAAEGTRKYTRRVIVNPQDWERLPELDPNAPHLAAQLECLHLLRKALGPDTPMLQTIFSPLAQAKNLAGSETLIAHLRKHPDSVMKGLETIASTTIKFIDKAMQEGIDGVFYAIQHAQAALLTLEEYASFGLPNDLKVLAPARDLWCNMLHLHGRDIHFSLLQHMDFHIVNWHDRETPPSLIDAERLFNGVLCGGLRQDTLVLCEKNRILEEAADAFQQTRGRKFILGTGCVVPITAPHGNLLTARRCVE